MASKLTFTSLALLLLAAVATAQVTTQTTTTQTTPTPTTQSTPTTTTLTTPTTATTTTTTQGTPTTTTLSPADRASIAGVVGLKVNITADLALCCQTGHDAVINTAIGTPTSKEAACTAIKDGLAACDTTGKAATCPAKLTAIKDQAELGIVCGSCSLIQASTLLMSLMAMAASLWSGRL